MLRGSEVGVLLVVSEAGVGTVAVRGGVGVEGTTNWEDADEAGLIWEDGGDGSKPRGPAKGEWGIANKADKVERVGE